MEVLNWLIVGTSVSGLAVYCAGMTLLLGALSWANHLDRRRNINRPWCVEHERKRGALVTERWMVAAFPSPGGISHHQPEPRISLIFRRRAERSPGIMQHCPGVPVPKQSAGFFWIEAEVAEVKKRTPFWGL